ncbi:MAG: phosphodiester glycosidase family protein [Gemmatimonadota bacterium]
MNRLGLATILAGVAAPPLAAQRFDSTFTRTIAPGVVHQRLVVDSAPWNINVVRVDLRRSGLQLRVVHAADAFLGRETLAALSERHRQRGDSVVAAINADFFRLSDGEVTNNQVSDAEWWRARHVWGAVPPIRSQFAVGADGRLLIERFNWNGSVSTRRYPQFALDGINIRPDPDEVMLFTPHAGRTTPRDSSTGGVVERTLVLLARHHNTLRFRLEGGLRQGGGSPLGPEYALVGGSRSGGRLAALGPAGTPLEFSMVTSPARGPIAALAGGQPRLVVNGRGLADTALADAEATNANLRQRHPRSAVGFTRDSSTLLLVTVDGRQPASAGMDLLELSRLMLRLGAFEALNLDGGGSSTLIVAGEVVNRPSDREGPRAIGNALLVGRPTSRRGAPRRRRSPPPGRPGSPSA